MQSARDRCLWILQYEEAASHLIEVEVTDSHGATSTSTWTVSVTDAIEANAIGGLLEGTPGSDTLVGADERDKMKAGSGDELLYGGRRNDKLLGGQGNDTLLGENGRDKLVGGSGDDVLIGGSGPDKLIGERDADTASFQGVDLRP